MATTIDTTNHKFLKESQNFLYGDVCKIVNLELKYVNCHRYLKRIMEQGYAALIYQT